MMAVKRVSIWLLCALSCLVDALLPHTLRKTLPSLDATEPGDGANSTFKQLIDHSNPSLGTFSQFYYYSTEFWKGPGSPVILTTPGETPVGPYEGYLFYPDIFRKFAEAVGGALVILEHRYYGDSSPFQDLTVKNLQYMTLDNAIADLTFFANNVNLPFDPKGSSHPSKAPWVLAGGSYAGALSAWTARLAEGTFWAYHASSAPVEAIYDFWQYLYPVTEYMPKECFQGVSQVIEHVDAVLQSGNQSQILALKTLFGLQELVSDLDFASALAMPMSYYWQENIAQFEYFCHYIETGAQPPSTFPPRSVADAPELSRALNGYATFAKKHIARTFCHDYYNDSFGNESIECLRTDDSKLRIYTDTAVSNLANRQWMWMLCNQPFAWWVAAPPAARGPSLVSRLVTAEYFQNQCAKFFPEEDGFTYGSAKGNTTKQVNTFTHGWEADATERLLFVNGQYDPWREAGVSSDFRPGGPLNSTDKVPLFLVPKGGHVPDIYVDNSLSKVQLDVIHREIKQMKDWVSMYPAQGYHVAPGSFHGTVPGTSPSAHESSLSDAKSAASLTFDSRLVLCYILSAWLIVSVHLF